MTEMIILGFDLVHTISDYTNKIMQTDIYQSNKLT